MVVRNFRREAKTIEIKFVVLSRDHVPSKTLKLKKAPLTFFYNVNLL